MNDTLRIDDEIYCDYFIFFNYFYSPHFTVEIMKYSILLMFRYQRFFIVSKNKEYVRNELKYFTDPTPKTLNTQPIFRICFF